MHRTVQPAQYRPHGADRGITNIIRGVQKQKRAIAYLNRGRDEGRRDIKEGTKEGRKDIKEGTNDGRKDTKEGGREGRKEGREEGREEGY